MTGTRISLLWWWLPLVLIAVSAPLWLHRYEPGTFIYLNTLFAAVAAPVWTGLSLLGNAWGIVGVTAPLLVLAPRLMWAWLCAAPFAILFARTGKFFLESPRPAAVVDNAQMRIVGEVLHNVSMPSGHTTTAFAVASAIFFALSPAQRKRHGWLLLLLAASALIFAAAWRTFSAWSWTSFIGPSSRRKPRQAKACICYQ